MTEEMTQSKQKDIVRKGIPWIIILGVILFFLFRMVFIPEEERVRRMIVKGIEAVEDQSPLRCANLVAQDYADSRGFGKRELVDAARRLFENADRIEIQISEVIFEQKPIRDSSRDGEELVAQVRLRMKVIFHEQRGILELIRDDPRASEYVILNLVKRNRRWLLQQMEFENINWMQYYGGL